jgi:site-specific DNA-cytosine methylase
VRDAPPRAVLLENGRGLAARRFNSYRLQVINRLERLGYTCWWNLIHASEHGVPQLRPRFVLIGVRNRYSGQFRWPSPTEDPPHSVGELLHDLMGPADGRAREWCKAARKSPRRLLAAAISIVSTCQNGSRSSSRSPPAKPSAVAASPRSKTSALPSRTSSTAGPRPPTRSSPRDQSSRNFSRGTLGWSSGVQRGASHRSEMRRWRSGPR